VTVDKKQKDCGQDSSGGKRKAMLRVLSVSHPPALLPATHTVTVERVRACTPPCQEGQVGRIRNAAGRREGRGPTGGVHEAEELSGAPEAGHDLVADHDDPELVAELPHPEEVPWAPGGGW